jgi:hypothetical protein
MTHRNLISRRTLMQGFAASAAFGLTPALAQNTAGWPDHAIRLVVPYPAGGSTDVLFRIIAERLKDKLGQAVVVENKPGASGNIGIDQVAKGAPDGYTIGGATVGHFSINQFLIAKMPYDAEKDLVAPSLVYELPNVAVVAAQHVPAAGQDAAGVRRLGQGAAERHLDRQPRARHDAASLRRAVRGAHRRQRRSRAVPRSRADHSGDAIGRCHLRGRQSGVLHLAD